MSPIPSITLPNGGGAIRGIDEKVSVSLATGSANVSVPIACSPGRGSIAPDLRLDYGSGNGNGPFGLGWRLSVPSVSRKTSRALPRYEDELDSDVFVLSEAEDLVPLLVESGTSWAEPSLADLSGRYQVRRYRPRVDSAFARIERWQEIASGDVHWRTTSRDNVTTCYGSDSSSRIADTSDPARVFSWLLDRRYDDRGNVLVCRYKPEDRMSVPSSAHEQRRTIGANRYLKRVLYGNVTPYRPQDDPELPAAWRFELVFDYGEHNVAAPEPAEATRWACRSDPFSSYRSGFEVRTYRLCRRVLMFHRFPEELPRDALLVRSTDLAYSTDVPADPTRPSIALLLSVTQTGYRLGRADTYQTKTPPPLELAYSGIDVDETVRLADEDALANLPAGVDGRTWRWADLDGEGLQGVLAEDDGAWYYRRNISAFEPGGSAPRPRFEPFELLASKPSSSAPGVGQTQLVDLHGDGRLCAVDFAGPVAGYFAREGDTWAQFTPFPSVPVIDWASENLRHVDLDGDGLADLLQTEADGFVWYPWRIADGFSRSGRVAGGRDEDAGPALVFANGESSIYLADMSGDGLAALVRIRQGEVCYWPNLGYGRFGAKVVMDDAPRFDSADEFDQRRIRLVDVDGSGTSDLIYLGANGVTLWFNQSGNSWAAPIKLDQFPAIDDIASVTAVDLLGRGTICLTWSSLLPGDQARQLRYVDLMGGRKPHLLTRVANNLGRDTTLTYTTSTRFYVEDHLAGINWLTRLAFPVHVVCKIETVDRVAGTRVASSYRYRHGYFDPVEREFRGFAMVEHTDTDELPAASGIGTFTQTPEVDGDAFTLPPVRTRKWFHTGAYVGGADLAATLRPSYYQLDVDAVPLSGAVFDGLSTPDELREACRALRGLPLRVEVYADDQSPAAVHPYLTTEHRYGVRRLQPPTALSFGSVHPFGLETLTYHYERHPDDPRISHELTLEVDHLGSVTKSVETSYPRRTAMFPEQDVTLVSYSEHDFANVTDQESWYRIGVPVESRSYELTGVRPPLGQTLFELATLGAQAAASAEISYDAAPDGTPQKRMLARNRSMYLADDLSTPLVKGRVESMAVIDRTYDLRMTPGMLSNVLGVVIPPAAATTISLSSEGGFVDLDNDNSWWGPSARLFYSPDPQSPDPMFARQHFYLPQGQIDPFGAVSRVEWAYDLAVVATTDRVSNRATATVNYRVLKPWLITDPNMNRTGVRFDELGMVVATATMGKRLADGSNEGDHLDLASSEPSPTDDPTSRSEYNLDAYRTWAADQNHDALHPQPVWSHSLARVRNHDPTSLWLETYVYTDGSGRIAMTKAQAESGDAPVRDASGRLVRAADGSLTLANTPTRWIGSGKVVYDQKGNAIKAYEPFFDSSATFDVDADLAHWGVTAIARFDPLGRLIRRDNPDGSFQSVKFDVWRQLTSDENDNVLASAWYAMRSGGQLGADQVDAAAKAAFHDSTPLVADLDSLGRTFHSIADGPGGQIETRLVLDIQGRVLATVDALARTAGRIDYDLQGHAIHMASIDAGERWMLLNADGLLLRGWDSRGNQVRRTYDPARRQLGEHVSTGGGPERLTEQTVYGEGQANDVAFNLRGAVFQQHDGAGLETIDLCDFKGNVVSVTRRMLSDIRAVVDWAAALALNPETFTVTTTFDALNRVLSTTTPDGSVTRPVFNERSLVNAINVSVRGSAVTTTYVREVSYDAKAQRLTAAFGNGAATVYTYEPETFRLRRLVTTRRQDGGTLQDLTYAYDPVGNLTRLADAAQSSLFFANQFVAPVCDYTYDVVYRLVAASGREHIGQATQQPNGWDDFAIQAVPLPTDPTAMRNYSEAYRYDHVGNFVSVVHSAGVAGSWNRNALYDEPNVPATNNRLTSTHVGATRETYSYDRHGNMTSMAHLSLMKWDYKNQLEATARQVVLAGEPETTWYCYDGAGRRARKATISPAGHLETERIYIGGYEIYREYSPAGTASLERQTLAVSDGLTRIALVETTAIDASKTINVPASATRYQYANHHGSATIELDQNAAVISYEEYYPYGSTSFQSRRSAAEVSLKRYRYSGKERDGESGLSYYGARYYAPWLGRWISPDPSAITPSARGSLRAYIFASDNPISRVDPDGNDDVAFLAAQQQGPDAVRALMARRATGADTAAAIVRGTTRALFDNAVGTFKFVTGFFGASWGEEVFGQTIEGVLNLPAAVSQTVSSWSTLSVEERAYRVTTGGVILYGAGRSAYSLVSAGRRLASAGAVEAPVLEAPPVAPTAPAAPVPPETLPATPTPLLPPSERPTVPPRPPAGATPPRAGGAVSTARIPAQPFEGYAPGQFGRGDVLYGTYPGGRLRATAVRTGAGVGGTDIPVSPEETAAIPRSAIEGTPAELEHIAKMSIATLERALAGGRQIRFLLEGLSDLPEVVAGRAWQASVTSSELRYLARNWTRFEGHVTFWRQGVHVDRPW